MLFIMNDIKTNLIWIDLEMTGLNPYFDRIIEIATIVTNFKLEIIEYGPSIVLNQSDKVISCMDKWNVEHHSKSGLLNEVKTSPYYEDFAEIEILKFLSKFSIKGASPMCGSSIYQDRIFIYRYMPNLYNFFHYRNIDVSSIRIFFNKILGFNCYSNINSLHRAKNDIIDSINELKNYINISI